MTKYVEVNFALDERLIGARPPKGLSGNVVVSNDDGGGVVVIYEKTTGSYASVVSRAVSDAKSLLYELAEGPLGELEPWRVAVVDSHLMVRNLLRGGYGDDDSPLQGAVA